jgi:glycopeptide antibiotics resistance protein
MKRRLLSACIFIAYGVILIKVLVFKDVPIIMIGPAMLNFGGTDASHPANFVPFKTILPYLLGEKGFMIAVLNIVGNIALLVPIGFLAPLVYKNILWKKTFVLAVASGLVIEGMQAVLHVGIFDIDDVILNGLGVMVGYWMFLLLVRIVHSMSIKIISITAVSLLLIIAGATFYAITVNQRSEEPVSFRAAGSKTNKLGNRQEGEIPKSGDLCGGTGGTGQIVSKRKNGITIKRNDGVRQDITLTPETTIRTASGSATEPDLQIGDRVTLVIYDSKTASTVLVCNVSGPKTQSSQ